MDSKYIISGASIVNVLNMEQTANAPELIRYNVAKTKVLIEVPPGSWYYNLSFAKSREEALEAMQAEEWQHSPEIYGV